MKTALLSIAAAIVSTLVAARPAAAGETVLVLVDGKADIAMQTSAQGLVADRFKDAGWSVKYANEVPALAGRATAELRACLATPTTDCTAKHLQPLSLDFGLLLVVDGPDANVVLTATLVDGHTGAMIVNDRRFCESCTADNLAATAKEFTRELVRQTQVRKGRATLRIRSTPKGARVMVDGEPVGVTDLEYSVYPGAHKISLDKPHYGIEVRDINALPNQPVELDVPLTATGGPVDGGGASPWKWVVTITGVLAVGAGAYLIVTDSPEVQDGQRQPQHQDSLMPGIITAAGGVVLVGVGIYLFVHDAKKSHVTVSFDHRSAFVGLTGSF